MVQAGGTFDYLRTRQNQGRQVVLMRMIQPSGKGGVVYFEFVPGRSAGGKTRAVDIYIYLSAEFAVGVASPSNPARRRQSVADVPRQITDQRARLRQRFTEVARYQRIDPSGEKQEALAQLKALRTDTKKEKSILLIRIRAAQACSDEKEYTEALEEFRKLYPNDACIDLLSIDYYTLKKDFPKAFECIDRLDKAIGGDPYLTLLRGYLSDGSR